jgi:hypothetical protein
MMKYIVSMLLIAVSLGGCASLSNGPGATSAKLAHPTVALPDYTGTVRDDDFMRSLRAGGG